MLVSARLSVVARNLAVRGALLVGPLLALAAGQDRPWLQPGDTAVRIGAQAVAWREFGAWLVQRRGEALADAFLDDWVIEREARGNGIVVDDEEALSAVRVEIRRRVMNTFRGSRQKWLEELARLGSNEANYIERRTLEIESQLYADRLLATRREVADDDVREEFERRYGKDGRLLRLRALRLRLRVPADGAVTPGERERRTAKAKDELLERLREIQRRAFAGEPFVDLVRAFNEDPQLAATDGAFEEPFRHLEWPADVVEIVYALQPGEVSDPVYGRGYYNLFELIGEERTSFERRVQTLREVLRTQPATAGERERLADELRADLPAELLPEMHSGSDDPAATVLRLGDEGITRAQLANWIGPRFGRQSARPFVEQWLAEHEASRLGIIPTQAELDRRFQERLDEHVARHYGGSVETWLADLERRGSDEGQVRRELAHGARMDVLLSKLVEQQRVIGPDDVRREWERTYGPGGRVMDVRILSKKIPLETIGSVPTHLRERRLDELVQDLLDDLAQLRLRALDGEDFGALIERESDDRRTRENGGREPDGFHYFVWPEPVRTALDSLAPGEVSLPLRVGSGCHLFELVGVTVVPFESVSDGLRAALESTRPSPAQRATYLAALLERHPWEFRP